MGAVPKKKLCWNCEGNVSKEIDNCPYCGVYLHSMETEENSLWNPSYRFSAVNNEGIPTPGYQPAREDTDEEEEPFSSPDSNSQPLEVFQSLLHKFKEDVLPILLLMSGSWLFLFATILFFFAEQGTLTLQWKSSYWIYFFLISIPSLYFGWKLLQQTESEPTIE